MPNKYYDISYLTNNGTPCTVVVKASNYWSAKTWFVEHKLKRLGEICGCEEINGNLAEYKRKGVPFLRAKDEEIKRDWWNADVPSEDLVDELRKFLKENNIYYELSENYYEWHCENYYEWHFECLCSREEELMLDRFWEEIVSE